MNRKQHRSLSLAIESLEQRKLFAASLGFNGGQPLNISNASTTTIQVENYDTGGEGTAYHDAESQNLGGAYRTTEGVDLETNSSGYDLAFTKAGE